MPKADGGERSEGRPLLRRGVVIEHELTILTPTVSLKEGE
jgi:hypothetical protein